MNPLVSVIVPCYNHAQYLSEALQSVLEQTYENWECIIVNDGSPDNTEEVAKEWLDKDSRFKYIQKENGGVCQTRNVGIEFASGVYILPLDSDDYISANYITECLNTIEYFNLKIAFGKATFFGERQGDFVLKNKVRFSDLLINNCIHCAAIFSKEDWEKCNGYDEEMKYGFEDWEFWLNLLKDGGEAQKVDNCVLYYRIKPISRSSKINQDLRKNEIMVDYIFQKHLRLYGYITTFKVYQEKLSLEEKLKTLDKTLTFKEIFLLVVKKIKFRISKFSS